MYLPRAWLEKGVLYLTQWNVLKIVRCGEVCLTNPCFCFVICIMNYY